MSFPKFALLYGVSVRIWCVISASRVIRSVDRIIKSAYSAKSVICLLNPFLRPNTIFQLLMTYQVLKTYNALWQNGYSSPKSNMI